MMRLCIAAVAFLATVPLFGQETYNKYHHGLPDERRPPNIPFRRGTVSVEPSQLYEEIPLAPTPVFILPRRDMEPRKIAALSQVRIPGPGGLPAGGGGPTITVTSAVCVPASASAQVASCTLGASGAVGDLLVIRSKTASAAAATVAWSFSTTSSCTPTTVNAATFQANGGGTFTLASAGCIITTAGANTPMATWTGSLASFTDIEAFTIHTSNTWKTTFVDQVQTSVATVTGVTCPTGTTTATTTANDFILATCDVFNAGQTWGALAGYTQYATASRNTAGIYYKTVTSTGTQAATVPLSASDFGVGMIAAFASN